MVVGAFTRQDRRPRGELCERPTNYLRVGNQEGAQISKVPSPPPPPSNPHKTPPATICGVFAVGSRASAAPQLFAPGLFGGLVLLIMAAQDFPPYPAPALPESGEGEGVDRKRRDWMIMATAEE